MRPTCNQASTMITQDALTRGLDLIATILQKMPNLKEGRRRFILEILPLFLSCRGRVNFSQLGRQGERYEQTYRNHFEQQCDWATINTSRIQNTCGDELVIGFDPSYISKSGKHTPGLGYFYSGVAGSYKRGLEIGNIAVIDIKQNTAYHLEAIRTPNIKKENTKDGRTIVNHYAELIIDRAETLIALSTILVVDGYFAKKKFIDPILNQTKLEVICRLRDDANLKYLASEKVETKKRGRPRKYKGKIDVKNIDRDQFTEEYKDESVRISGIVAYSVGLNREIKISYVEFLDAKGGITTTKLFFSTNLDRTARQIYSYYKARFQMEFIFRDAKQNTGLENCQSRSENKLNFHFNASLTAVNLAKVILRDGVSKEVSIPLSVGNLKMIMQNRNMLYRIFSIYGISHKLIKIIV